MFSFPVDRRVSHSVRRRAKWLVLCFLAIVVVDQSGLLLHPMEKSLSDGFSYPLDLPDLRLLLHRILSGQDVDVKPINSYDYRFTIANREKCRHMRDPASENASHVAGSERRFPRLVLLVKSSLSHRRRRDTIRKTWGFEERFSDVAIRRVFLLGSCDSDSARDLLSGSTSQEEAKSCQDLIDEEHASHGDIVQADFHDTYFNNTIKTMIGFKWLTNTCPDAEFAFFVDDDYYVSVKNLLRFSRHPFPPDAPEDQVSSFDGRLYAGYVFATSAPMRHKVSKWFIPLSEYPYSRFPPYVTAGAYLLSNQAFKELHLASRFVKHFRFDDIYVGILARKIALSPIHSTAFHFHKKAYTPAAYSSVIASHGFDEQEELLRVWNEQRALGSC